MRCVSGRRLNNTTRDNIPLYLFKSIISCSSLILTLIYLQIFFVAFYHFCSDGSEAVFLDYTARKQAVQCHFKIQLNDQNIGRHKIMRAIETFSAWLLPLFRMALFGDLDQQST